MAAPRKESQQQLMGFPGQGPQQQHSQQYQPEPPQQQHMQQQQQPPSLFDLFYEELLTQLMDSGELQETIPQEFMKLSTDIERVEYLTQLRPLVTNLEIKTKIGLKSMEKSTRYREEGNKLFQNEQTTQAILYYNKSLSYAPHPNVEEYLHPEPDHEKVTQVQFKDESTSKLPKIPGLSKKKVSMEEDHQRSPAKFEALALCYANRSAALRRLCQYEDCLRDIARAARFGYPKENMFKLWERKGKCYFGLKRYELAAKCLRQSVQSLKESGLSEPAKAHKVGELQALLKEWRSTQYVMQIGEEGPEDGEQPQQPLMGATGPLVLVPSIFVSSRKTSEAAAPAAAEPPPSSGPAAGQNPRPERKSFRQKLSGLTGSDKHHPPPPPQQQQLQMPPANGEEPQAVHNALGRPTGSHHPAPPSGELHKADSKMSISQLSGSGVAGVIRPDIDVPDLSYGVNHRMPSASIGIDLRFAPDKGRFFVATQDLLPGDVILREEPYAAVLESIFRVNHCAHCLRKTPTPIPCYECATVQYCCETCRDLSWNEYHGIECGILGYLEPSRYLGKMPHLALRIITKTGMQSLIQHSMAQMLPNLKNGSDDGMNVMMTGQQQQQHHHHQPAMFDPTSYRSVHNLATNCDKRSFEDLIKKTAEAIFMARCLKFNGFFGVDHDKEDTRRAEMFISSLLLRHLQIASTNGLEMAECLLKNNDVTKFDIIPVGGAIFPTMSFFNHCCYPNALRLGYQSYQVIRVIRTIRKGEEVTIDYGFDFYANPLERRQKRATSQYHFTCQCAACVQNWPVYNELMTKQRRWKVQMTNELAEEAERQAMCYQVAMEHLIRLDIPRALPLFRDYLLLINELVEHPDPRYIDCEEAYKQCLWLENRGYKPKPQPHHHQQQHLMSGFSGTPMPR